MQLGGGKAAGEDVLNIQVQAKDSGMMIVTTLTPNLEWTGGAADLALQYALSCLHCSSQDIVVHP